MKDLDQVATNYSSGARAAQESQLDASFTQVDSTTAQSITALPGISDILESRNIKDLFSE